MIKVSMVPKDYVLNVWDEVKPHLDKVIEHTHGRFNIDDILNYLLTDDEFVLWIAFDEKEIKGAVVTHVTPYPRGKYLCMLFCGGVEFETWGDQIVKLMQHWAHDTGCVALEASGRPGWAKILKANGYKPLWQTFELPAANAGLGD